MELHGKINFNNVEALTLRLGQRKISTNRFSFDIPVKECANGLYSALKVEVARRNRTLQLDESTKNHILEISEWLTDRNGKSGLLLRGGVGNGKTSFLRAMINLISYATEEVDGYSRRKEVVFKTATDIARMVSSDNGKEEYRKLVKTPMLAIDELGEEPTEVMVYGMIYEPLKELLLERYSYQLFTVITSNLTSNEMKKKYSQRITDRFREMMKIVNFANPSYR